MDGLTENQPNILFHAINHVVIGDWVTTVESLDEVETVSSSGDAV